MTNIVLASASPRREELLRQIGLKFLIRPSNIEERRGSNEEPADYVHRLSQEKAEHQAGSNAVVIAADTTVVVDNTVLEKPVDASDGVAMLMQLSGRVHEVMTGVTVSGNDRRLSQVVISTVAFLIFHILNTTFEKMGRELLMDPALAIWLPSMILAPIALWLTKSASSDTALVSGEWFSKIVARLNSKKS